MRYTIHLLNLNTLNHITFFIQYLLPALTPTLSHRRGGQNMSKLPLRVILMLIPAAIFLSHTPEITLLTFYNPVKNCVYRLGVLNVSLWSD